MATTTPQTSGTMERILRLMSEKKRQMCTYQRMHRR